MTNNPAVPSMTGLLVRDSSDVQRSVLRGVTMVNVHECRVQMPVFSCPCSYPDKEPIVVLARVLLNDL